MALLALLVGLLKIFIGLSRQRPVAILVGLCATAFVIALAAFLRRPLRSRFGDAVLRQLRVGYKGSWGRGGRLATLSAAEFAMVLGLFGLPVLAGTEMDPLRRALLAGSFVSTGSGAEGGGCGGSGCGGGGGGGCGGGGCGGCGGG